MREEHGQNNDEYVNNHYLVYAPINSNSYTRALEERVAFLEQKLVRSEPSVAPGATPQGSQATPPSGLDNNPIGEIVGLLALSSSEAPAYVGSSSGVSLAANLGEMVQASVWNQFISRAQMQNQSNVPGSAAPQNISGPNAPQPGSGGNVRNRDRPSLPSNIEPPSDEVGYEILETYFKRLHLRYPFLDRKELWRLHGERWRLAKTKREELSQSDRFAIFKLNLVYAIGATMIQMSDRYAGTPPEVYSKTFCW